MNEKITIPFDGVQYDVEYKIAKSLGVADIEVQIDGTPPFSCQVREYEVGASVSETRPIMLSMLQNEVLMKIRLIERI